MVTSQLLQREGKREGAALTKEKDQMGWGMAVDQVGYFEMQILRLLLKLIKSDSGTKTILNHLPRRCTRWIFGNRFE